MENINLPDSKFKGDPPFHEQNGKQMSCITLNEITNSKSLRGRVGAAIVNERVYGPVYVDPEGFDQRQDSQCD